MIGGAAHLKPIIAALTEAGCRVSLFIEPDKKALDMALALGAPVVELHTGTWCDALVEGQHERAAAEFSRLSAAATHGAAIGLEVHAGHGLDYASAEILAAVPAFVEFNIGHFLMGEALFVGLEASIRGMRAAMDKGAASPDRAGA